MKRRNRQRRSEFWNSELVRTLVRFSRIAPSAVGDMHFYYDAWSMGNQWLAAGCYGKLTGQGLAITDVAWACGAMLD